MSTTGSLCAWIGTVTLVACAGQPEAEPVAHVPASASVEASFVDIATALAALCERAAADPVHDLFCGATTPSIHGLADLEHALALDFSEPLTAGGAAYPNTIAPDYHQKPQEVFIVLLGHSTALSGELVSPINPRAFVMSRSLALAFTRGVQQVELAARDRDTQAFNFYLVRFEQACNAAAVGCTPADRYTGRAESDWTRMAVDDAEALKNTPLDCRQCHQRARETPLLLMRELNGPWPHFFGREDEVDYPYPEPTGGALMRDFLAAKANEGYAGAGNDVLRATEAFTLRDFIDYQQPLVLDGLKIMRERWPSGPDGYPSEPQRSATWDAAFRAFQRGEQLALPYYAPRATDPAKQAQLTAAYASGDPEALPELSDIFPDDPTTRAEIGLQTVPGATPAQALVQACGSCHNDVLDPTLSRARFHVALGRLERSELDVAIARSKAPRGSAGAMPPHGARQLDDAARAGLIAYLETAERSVDDDALLERAAELGMTGGAARLQAAGTP